MHRNVIAAILAFSLPANAVAQKFYSSVLDTKKAKRMAPDEAAAKILRSDDPLESGFVLSTDRVLEEYTGIAKALNQGNSNDNYMYANVDRKSGQARYVVVQKSSEIGTVPFYTEVSFNGPDGLLTVPTLNSTHRFDGCGTGIVRGICTSSGMVEFEVPEAALRHAASAYEPSKGNYWMFRLRSPSGDRLDQAISDAEIAGLLIATEAYQRELASKK